MQRAFTKLCEGSVVGAGDIEEAAAEVAGGTRLHYTSDRQWVQVCPMCTHTHAHTRTHARTHTHPGQDSPSPPGRCARFSEEDGPPLALAGGSDHPLGWTPRPPQAGAPGYWKMMAPHGPCRRFRPPPGLGSPSPPGRCARLLADDASPWALQEAPTTPWPGLPVPPRPVRPVLRR